MRDSPGACGQRRGGRGVEARRWDANQAGGGGQVRVSRVTPTSRAARHNPSMDNTTNPHPGLVSNVRDVRRVPLGRLAGRDTDRADAPAIGFNSSI